MVYLGELDNKDELEEDSTPLAEIDVQGPGRIERGRYFCRQCLKTAEAIGTEVKWEMIVVPNVVMTIGA